MKLDGYIRVSRVGGRTGDAFISPGEQRERVRAWAKSQGHRIAKWHEDLDQPGSKADRPGLNAAMERIEAGLARLINSFSAPREWYTHDPTGRVVPQPDQLHPLDAALAGR